jgi:hypothetical protein
VDGILLEILSAFRQEARTAMKSLPGTGTGEEREAEEALLARWRQIEKGVEDGVGVLRARLHDEA